MKTTAPNRVTSGTRGALTILTAAEAGDLPMPDQVQVMDLHTKATLTLFLRSLEDLTHWSIWLDEPIDTGHGVHDGEMLGQPVRVVATMRGASS